MKNQILVFILLSTISFGCNKERSYTINILNETEFDINKLELSGTSDYIFDIKKGGESGQTVIEWVGARSHWNGEHCFSYYVNDYSDSTTHYSEGAKCGGCIVVRDLSEDELNTLRLQLNDPGESDCGKHRFKIKY